MKTRRVRAHRRRLEPFSAERYAVERYMSDCWEGCRSVGELRERFRAFVASDTIWISIEHALDASKIERKAFETLRLSIQSEFPKKTKGKKK